MGFSRARPPPDIAHARSPADAVASTSDPSYEGDGRVGESTIVGAGLGVFATRRLPRGSTARGVTYGGDVMTLLEAVAMPKKDKAYVMALHLNVHVDARRHYGYVGRYVNDSAGTANALNAEFVKDAANRRATLRTVRDVEAGEEFFAAYGKGYWERERAIEGDGVATVERSDDG